MLTRDDRAAPSFTLTNFADVRAYLDEDPRGHEHTAPGALPLRGKDERHFAAILQDPGFGTLLRLQRALERMPHSFDN